MKMQGSLFLGKKAVSFLLLSHHLSHWFLFAVYNDNNRHEDSQACVQILMGTDWTLTSPWGQKRGWPVPGEGVGGLVLVTSYL